jgi:hypothetical protein
MVMDRIKAMLSRIESGLPAFPPTTLFGEQWLLRVILDWFETHGGDRYPMSLAAGSGWFSEAWLPSAFLPRYRGDHLGESRTHADAAIGQFRIGDPGTSGLTLEPFATQFVLIEAKLNNRLSAGVKNAPGFDQAARSVACMAEVLRRSGRRPEQMDDLAFLILAPQNRIDDGVFARNTAVESIRRKVQQRIEPYQGERDAWQTDWFEPTLDQLVIRCLAWEEVIETIAFHDPIMGQAIDAFYGKCLHFNRPSQKSAYPGPRTGANRPWTPNPRQEPAVEPRRLEPSTN